MTEHRPPGLLLVDEQGAPPAILPASQMIKALVPPTRHRTTRHWMAQVRSPLVVVVDKDKTGVRLLGVITSSHLLERLLPAAFWRTAGRTAGFTALIDVDGATQPQFAKSATHLGPRMGGNHPRTVLPCHPEGHEEGHAAIGAEVFDPGEVDLQ